MPHRAATWLAALTAILGVALPAAAQPIVGDVPLAGGGSERVLVVGPTAPRALLVMLAGGDGTVAISDQGAVTHLQVNFLLRTQPLWLGQGFAVAVLGPPNGASLLGQRHTPAYADAMARAIDFARGRINAPVWLLGTSMGSIAAANGAAHLPGRVAGVVLTSSVASRTSAGETVFDSDLGAIAVPALVVANQSDACASASPGMAPQILAALTRAPRKDLILLDSSAIQGPACEAMSPHGFLGIESQTIARISDWIRAASGR
jgi:pimeloyl-ACP methyl ester carboxylesterase